MRTFLPGLVCLLLLSLPATAQKMRITSYNTHNCIGMDGVRDYDRIARVISDAAPDLVALQELDSVTVRNKEYVLGELALRTSMHPTFGAAIEYGGGKYGIGILSKEKPLSVRRIPLPGREEPRLLLIAEFEGYVMCCTHFSLTPEDRVTSARIILDAVRDVSKPLFLAGDMNDHNGSAMQDILTERFTPLSDPALATFNSGECIDFIYGYDNGVRYRVLSRGVIDERIASDHMPLWVDVSLSAP